jgi:hypothetical protein
MCSTPVVTRSSSSITMRMCRGFRVEGTQIQRCTNVVSHIFEYPKLRCTLGIMDMAHCYFAAVFEA